MEMKPKRSASKATSQYLEEMTFQNLLQSLPAALFRRGGGNNAKRPLSELAAAPAPCKIPPCKTPPPCKIPRRATPFAQLPRPLAVCSCVAQSVVVYETNFHKIALYPPWAAATVPPAKCPLLPCIAGAPILANLAQNITHSMWLNIAQMYGSAVGQILRIITKWI